VSASKSFKNSRIEGLKNTLKEPFFDYPEPIYLFSFGPVSRLRVLFFLCVAPNKKGCAALSWAALDWTLDWTPDSEVAISLARQPSSTANKQLNPSPSNRP
jgi:hypothetical protein